MLVAVEYQLKANAQICVSELGKEKALVLPGGIDTRALADLWGSRHFARAVASVAQVSIIRGQCRTCG